MPREMSHRITITVYTDADDPFNRAVGYELLRRNHPREREYYTYILATEADTKDARADLSSAFSDFLDVL